MSKIQKLQKLFSWSTYIINVFGTTILLLIIGHFIIGVGINIRNSEFNRKSIPKKFSPAYDNYHYDKYFMKEHSLAFNIHFEPYIHWRRDKFVGTYINVNSNGTRKTIASNKKNNAKKIFMFGGSTLWGTGVKDKHTIPSFLQSLLGDDYVIFNHGETAYVSAQELNYLLLLITKKMVPDIVIFYDGANDGYAGVYSPAIPRDPHNLRMRYKNEKLYSKSNSIARLYNNSNYKLLINYILTGGSSTDKWEKEIKPKIEVNAEAVVDIYESHIQHIKALAQYYGFKVYFIWQPNLLSKTKKTTPYETKIINNSSPVFIESQRLVYLKAKKKFFNRKKENIFFMSDIFNNINETIYINWCHLGPSGNEIIAKEIYSHVLTP